MANSDYPKCSHNERLNFVIKKRLTHLPLGDPLTLLYLWGCLCSPKSHWAISAMTGGGGKGRRKTGVMGRLKPLYNLLFPSKQSAAYFFIAPILTSSCGVTCESQEPLNLKEVMQPIKVGPTSQGGCFGSSPWYSEDTQLEKQF